ncbi:MAG: U32 family peptidase [Clostridia bacterium]|nr:U32 family peptidase [Clostridia bacterium]
MTNRHLELLAPAGDPEKLRAAVDFGADAVYLGGGGFDLRAGAGGFSRAELVEGLAYAHARGCRCYLTVNIYAHEEDLAPLKAYLYSLEGLAIDAFIVADPAVILLIREVFPHAEFHLSTQANTTNSLTARFWYGLGVKRIVLARELSLAEIREMRKSLPPELELEAFVHGSMCMSYSGRCLLSNFLTGRDANHGACAHPCRWQYALQEEKRPGEYFPIEEDARGTYIMNSRDLCLLAHLAELAESGITSFKIEGRNKSVFYCATVTNAYRMAIDAYTAEARGELNAGELDDVIAYCWEEVGKVSHRGFTTGFYFHKPAAEDHEYGTSSYIRTYSFTGVVRDYDPVSGLATVEQRNKMTCGEEIECFGPGKRFFRQTLTEMYDKESGEALVSAPHPQQMLLIRMEEPVSPGFLIRKRKENNEH